MCPPDDSNAPRTANSDYRDEPLPQTSLEDPPLANQVIPPDQDSAPAADAGRTALPRRQPDAPTAETARQPAPAPEREFGNEMLLQTHGLVKVYDGRAVVNGVDINVRPGEIVGLLGPNGAGKTTTFYMIVGLVPPNGGEVIFDGADVTSQPMYKRARLGMGYLPQEESIFRKLTVRENIMAVMETLPLSKAEREDRTQQLLKSFGILHIADNIALTCSGGEKRRLTIARSLVTQPSLLMLDEPFSGVDPIAVSEIQNIVRSLRKAGLAILITDHNVRETLEIVDRAYLIYEGKVLREGTRDFLINDPVSRELYLGDRFSM
ncbi:MAG: LPS export ABC transporter ATP-binding protein [Verrucomicrobiae bacterium]|nr:LPS export ABC transporter ATP-binding protein [Verrucomicrobiae bacterium]